MKKIFFILLVIYFIPAVAGNYGWQYFENKKASAFFYEYWYVFAGSAIIVFAIFYWLAKKTFPILSDVRYKKFIFFARIVFFFFIVIVNVSYVKFINNYIGPQKAVMISGTVTNKYKIFKRKKQDTRSVEITTATNEEKYFFRLKTSAYNSLNEGDTFSKEFIKGSLGMLFRKDE